MKRMDSIDGVRVERRKLEKAIGKLLVAFSSKTGMGVREITAEQVWPWDAIGVGVQYQRTSSGTDWPYRVKVKLEDV